MVKINKRIIFIGDDQDIREARDLKTAGYDIELAHSMEEAVAKLSTGDYSGVIADPNIAGRSGGVAAFEDIELRTSKKTRRSADWLPAIKHYRLDQCSEDSAELKRVERDLYFFKYLAEHSDDPFYIVDPNQNFRLIYVNEAATRHFNIERDKLLAMSIPDFNPLFSPEHCIKFWEELKFKGSLHFETVHRRADGHEMTVEVSANYFMYEGQELFAGWFHDISERKQAEEALRESEERLKAIVDNLTEGLIVVDPHGQTIHWNHTALEMYGYTSGEKEIRYVPELLQAFEVSTLDGHILPIEDWPVSRLLRGETMRDYELHIYHKKKKWQRIFSYSGTLVRNASGEPLIGILTIRDITARKQAERALRESEERLARAQQSSLVMPLHVSLDGRWIKVTPNFARFLGYDNEEELLGREFKDFTHPDNFLADWSQVLRLLNGEIKSFELEKRFIRKDGSITWGYINCSVVTDEHGNPVHLLTYVRDINEQKRLEQELVQARAEAERREAEMGSFFSSMADGAALIDADGSIIYINEAGRSLLGLTGDESVNWEQYQRHAADGKLIPFDETAVCRALRGELVKGMNERLITPDGRELILYVSASPVYDNSGNVVAVTNVLRDDSARVQFEKQRSELYEREHRIASMLQQALIPPEISDIGRGYNLAVKYQPAWNEAEVGGDFYDVFALGHDKIGILIGDVAGKGLQAAMSVAAARYTIRSLAYLDPIPAKVMTLANETLCRSKDSGPSILTAFFAVLDINTGILTYSSAGHEPPLMCSGGQMCELEVQGRMLGILGDYIYSQASHKMGPGDLIIMVTDGITEARRDRSLFGKEGIKEYLSGHCLTPPAMIADGLLEAAREYAGGKLQDDVAIVVLKAESKI